MTRVADYKIENFAEILHEANGAISIDIIVDMVGHSHRARDA